VDAVFSSPCFLCSETAKSLSALIASSEFTIPKAGKERGKKKKEERNRK
jgi:hypothetical protein